MTPAIRVENLSKRYHLGLTHARSIRELVGGLVSRCPPWRRRPTGGPSPEARACGGKNDFVWALRDVSFEVQPGEVVGVIGHNGAGKSTILKILSRIVAPTTGRVEVRGRIASLLEVGTGFHPELTGRENVFLNGTILGMTRAEVRRKFDEIVAFAEVERFIDTPVKRYSSGMYTRLAFAVAAHLDSEIMLIDEVLAVGDAAFQRKCLGTMSEVAKHGRTVLVISHNMVAISRLCTNVMLLESGEVAMRGSTERVVESYLKRMERRTREDGAQTLRLHAGNDRVQLISATVHSTEQGIITISSPIHLTFSYDNRSPDTVLNLSLSVFNSDGICVFATASPPRHEQIGLIRTTCVIPGNFLNADMYYSTLMVVQDGCTPLLTADALAFEVHELRRDGAWYGKWPGVVRPALPWTTDAPTTTNGL